MNTNEVDCLDCGTRYPDRQQAEAHSCSAQPERSRRPTTREAARATPRRLGELAPPAGRQMDYVRQVALPALRGRRDLEDQIVSIMEGRDCGEQLEPVPTAPTAGDLGDQIVSLIEQGVGRE